MPHQFEKGPEQIPSKETVLEIIKHISDYNEVVREESDERGLYLLEVKVWGENPGEYVQYEYLREGIHPKGSSEETTIHKVFYEDDMPCGGHDVTNFRNGNWEMTEK